MEKEFQSIGNGYYCLNYYLKNKDIIAASWINALRFQIFGAWKSKTKVSIEKNAKLRPKFWIWIGKQSFERAC